MLIVAKSAHTQQRLRRFYTLAVNLPETGSISSRNYHRKTSKPYNTIKNIKFSCQITPLYFHGYLLW